MADVSTFVKLDRNIVKWRWFQDPNTFRLFIYLIISANIEDCGFMGVTIHRGQLATSHASLATTLNMTVDQIRTALGHLKSTGEITVRRYPKFSVISILCYDKYQSTSHSKSQSNPSHVPVKSQSRPNNQRIKESKNGRNKDNPASRPMKWVTDDHGIGRWEYDD